MAETVVIDISLGDSFKKLAQIKSEIKDLRAANKDLDKQVKEGIITTEQASKAQVVNEASIRDLTKQQRRLRQAVDAGTKAQNGSIQANIVKLRQLKDAYERLANPTKAQAKEIADLSAKINKQKLEIGDFTSNIGNYSNSVQDAFKQTGVFSREIAILEKVQKTTNEIYKQATNQLRLLASQFKKGSKETDENTAATAQNTTATVANTKGSKLLAFAKKAVGVATKGATLATKAFTVALASTGIGAIIVALGALSAALTSSEEGQNKLAKATSVVSALFGNVVDLLADLGELIISAFENPQAAIKAFATLIKDNIVNRLVGLIELVPELGKAIGLLFRGEFKEAGQVATDAVVKVSLGVDGVTEKLGKATDAVKDFAKEQVKEAKLAADVADMRAKADILQRKLTEDRAKLESQIAELRLKARQEDQFTAEERKKALLDAQSLQEKLVDQETEYLVLRRDAQVLENTFSRTNKENKDKEAEAIAAVNQQIANRANIQRQVQRELNRVNNEIARDSKAASKAREAEQKRIEQAQKAELEREEKKRELLIKVRDEINETFVSEVLGIEKEAEAFRQAGATEVEVREFTAKKMQEIEEKKSKILFDELKKREAEFTELQDAETKALIIGFNEQILAAQGNKDEIARIEEEKKQLLLQKTRETVEGQIQILTAELEKATASVDGLGESVLSEEDKQELNRRIESLKVKLSEVNVELSAIGQDEDGQPRTFAQLIGVDEESLNFALGTASNVVGELGGIFANLSKIRVQNLEQERDELLDAAGDNADQRAAIEKDFESKIAAERKKGLEQKKKFDVTEATMTMLKSVITAFNTGMQAGLPLGPILASTLSALAIASGSAQIAAIKKQKFADGGVVDVGGNLHSQGGTTYVGEDGNMFEVERGEKMFVLNRGASGLINSLSNINQAFGGVPLSTKTKYAQDGGVIDGGFSTRQISGEVAGKLEIAEMVANSVQGIRPQVAVTEINAVNSRLTQAVEISEL